MGDKPVHKATLTRRRNKARGDAFEKLVRAYLESIGWQVDKARPTLKRFFNPRTQGIGYSSTQNDFWGVADLIAVKPSKQYTLVIQCTLHTGYKLKRDKLETINWNLDAQRVMIWTPDVRVGAKKYKTDMRVFWMRDYVKDDAGNRKGIWQEHYIRLENGIAPVTGLI